MRLVVLLVLLLTVQTVAANHTPCPPEDCIPIVPIPNVPFLQGTLAVDHFVAEISAVDGLATTKLELNVKNPGNATAEAILNVPLPAGASLLAFNLTIGDKLLEATVQEKVAARATYEAAKATDRAAALIEKTSEQLVTLSVAIPAGSSGVLRAAYIEWVPVASGDLVYRLPLGQMPLAWGGFDVRMTVRESGAFSNLRSVGSTLPFDATAGIRATGSRHEAGPAAVQDLIVAWTPSGSAWRSTFVSSLPAGPGATDVPAIARLCLSSAPVLARDVVFVLDRSGSMRGAKWEQAREALRGALLTLREGDWYNVVVFDSHVDPLVTGMTPVTPSEIEQDRKTLAGLEARGGTDINGALQEALVQLATTDGSGRMPQIVFVTDGLPSAGVTHHQTIIDNFRANNARHAPIFVVPIGLDADAIFLADLALHSGGTVSPMAAGDAQLGERLSRLYDTVGHLLVANVVVTTEDGVVVGGRQAPVAEDSCAQVAVRADLSGPEVVLALEGEGTDGAVRQEFRFKTASLRVDDDAAALYGHAVVQDLLSQERTGTAGLQLTITELAVATRQLTPYTSWILADLEPADPASLKDFDGEAPQSGRRETTVSTAGTATSAPPAPAMDAMAGFSFAQSPAPQYGIEREGDIQPRAPGTAPGHASAGAGIALIGLLVLLVALRRR